VFKATTATNKLIKLTKRIRGISGGTSASKTISILLWLIDYAQTHHNELISVVSETLPHLRKGAMRDFETIMKTHNYFKESLWNATNSIYTFETGTKLEFFSADQSDKVRGPRRDILFINEANNINYETYTQLEIRTRNIIWLDWNPVSEFWFYTEVKDSDDVDFLILTYKDNEALEQSIIQSIESRRANKNWWLVYGEGLLGESEGRIYTGWNTEFETVPHEARLERYGMDFGYSNDPTAIIAIYKWNGAYILDEITYLKGLSNKNITDLFINLPRALIVADSAEPKSIDEIKSYGLNIIGATKGSGSILQGIQFVQQQQIFVTKRSTNLIKEYRNYLWMTDKDGKIINVPQDFLNHLMDALRYGMDTFQNTSTFKMPSEVGGVNPYLEGLIA
jgi:phage terminase large subunit